MLPIGFHDDDTSFSTEMLWFEVYDVADAHSLVLSTLNNQSHLPVGIDVIARRSDVVMQRIARVRHIGGSDMPELLVIFNPIEQVEVFGFDGSQGNVDGIFCFPALMSF